MKNWSEIDCELKGGRGVLLGRGQGPNCFISFSSEKHVFITIRIHFFPF